VFLRCVLWIVSTTAVVVIVCWLVSIARCTWIGVIVRIACAVVATSISIIVIIIIIAAAAVVVVGIVISWDL